MSVTLKNFRGLCDDVALHLVGRSVKTLHNYPTFVNCIGTAFRVEDQAVVGINPSVTGEDELKTWLHELAHVREQYSSLANYKSFSDLPQSMEYHSDQAELEIHDTLPAEIKADRLADDWYAWSTAFWQGFDSYNELAGRLKALQVYPDMVELAAKVTKAVMDSVRWQPTAAIKRLETQPTRVNHAVSLREWMRQRGLE